MRRRAEAWAAYADLQRGRPNSRTGASSVAAELELRLVRRGDSDAEAEPGSGGEVYFFPAAGGAVVLAVQDDGPLQGPAALADGVGVDEAGEAYALAFGFEVGPVEAVEQVEGAGHLVGGA